MDSITTIPLAECQKGHVYELRSRNLDRGVFDGETGFIGIRTKFDSRFLFTEYHYETGAPHGTASPVAYVGPLPAEIGVYEYEQSVDRESGRPVGFDRPVASGGRGWYYTDTNEADQSIRSMSPMNQPLFDSLDSLEPIAPANDRTLRVRGRFGS
jgi:hypothetical protein